MTGVIEQEGMYSSSRRVENHLYILTKYSNDPEIVYKDQSKGIPTVNGEKISCDCIYIPERPKTSHFLVLSSVDLNNPSEIKDSKAILSNGYNFYVSTENIYVAESLGYDEEEKYNQTEIVKFSYNNGDIEYVNKEIVKGGIDDSFSMDEYEENLRIVTTVYDIYGKNTNSLYVLDRDLKIIGKIENLAKDERIYSARFMGDVGYFVTFRQVDPLFSVDLSDPENPKIIGELKITGFSEYLHFYSDDLLLGIGKEVDPDTNRTVGIKLSMFDISDPSDVKEINKYVMEDVSDSFAFYNHKAVMIDTKKNIFGFSVENWNDIYVNRYRVFEYTGSGFKQLMDEDILKNLDEEYWGVESVSLYIDKYLYVVTNTGVITSYDMENYKQKEVLLIK